MIKVGWFQKVSFEQFLKDAKKIITSGNNFIDNEEAFESQIKEIYDNIKLPKRATGGSGGNDFSSPWEFTLQPGETILFPSGIRVKIDEGWLLAAFPRSGLGFKYRLKLDNTVGIIDSDYHDSANEGHIMFKMTNEGIQDIHINTGDRIAQGIFFPYGITYDDDASESRNGGFGSTGK